MSRLSGTCAWKVLAVATLAFGLSCGGGDSDDTSADTELSGRVYYAGPVENATVIVYQLVDGDRTGEIGRATTDATGRFALNVGLAYETLELEARGGAYAEPLGGTIDLDDDQVLRGVALDVAPAEKRGDVAVTPWSHLVVTLGEARLATGTKEPSYNAALDAARDHLAAHLGFDPTRAAIAPLDATATSPTQPVQHALSLAGLAALADGVRIDAALTAQDLNTTTLLGVLTADAGSAEALFDGNGDALALGPACDRTTDCDDGEDACRTACAIYWNTLRSRLGVAIAAFLQTEANASPLAREDVQSWLEALAANADPELFGGPVEPLDELGPTIVWGAPAAGAEVSGAVAIEVTASDPLGVASLTVSIVGAATIPLDDDDVAAESFTTTLTTSTLPEGLLTFEATAVDEDGNETRVTRTVTLNNVDGGTVSGVVFKGRVDGATVRVYEFEGGARGALLGEGTTQSDGTFNNVAVADGYAGPLLIEAGFQGTYTEEAAPSGTADVTLDLDDRLRTVIIDYADGDAVSNVVASPLTSFAVTYLGWLRGQAPTGDLAAQWQTAHDAIEDHFAVPNILQVTPLEPFELSSATLTAAAKYGLVAIGLSETAFQASTQGGGTGGAFGTTMNAARVVEVLEADLADGCWDGRMGPTPLYWGGTEAVSSQATRIALANQIVSYLDDAARNVTAFTGPVDVLSLLDTLAMGGPGTGAGSCAGGGLYPDEGNNFDQTPPTIAWTAATPAEGAYVRGTITFGALATDNLDMQPAMTLERDGSTLPDADGDAADRDATTSINTVGMDGPVSVSAVAVDDSGNTGTRTVNVTADNTAPVVSVTAPAEGSFGSDPVTLQFAATDNIMLGAVTATLNGNPILTNHMVTSSGSYTFEVRATDLATNETVVTRNFTIDTGGPVITFGSATPLNLSAHRDPFDVVATATDPNGLASFAVTAPAALAGMDADATMGGLRVTVSPAALGDGNVTVALRAVDMAGNVGTVSRTFQLDRTAPTLSVTAPADGSYRNTAATITFSASDNLSAPSVSATLDGTPIASGATVNGEGPHTLTVRAVDAAGNEAVVSRTFTIDLTGPTVAFDVTTPAENSAHNATFLVKATASDGYGLASLVPVAPSGVPDNDGVAGDGDLELTVSPVALGDRYLTVTVRATDRAGNFAEAERHFWLDRTAPTGSVAQVSGTWYVAAGEATTTTVTMSGTSADATSGVASIAISRTPGGFAQTLTSGLGAWSTNVPLVASACGAAAWNGDNTFDVVITDRAGNSATIQDVVLRYDNCDADVAVVPTPNVAADTSTLLFDERSATVAVRATSYAPCLYQDSSLTPTTLNYDVNATPAPAASSTSYKYRANHAAAAMDCSTGTGWITGASPPSGYSPLGANRLGWYLDVRDNVGILSVQYEVKGPGEASYRAPQMAAAYALAGSTATHRFFMDESNVAGMDVEGVWEVRLTVTDLTGRVMSPANPIKWTHRVLAGPFYFENVTITDTTVIPAISTWKNPKSTTFGLAAGDVMTQLYTATNTIVIQKVTVYNGTSKTGYAALTPSGSLSYTRWIWEGSHRDGWAVAKPSCANVVGESYAPATASGSCLASAPTDSHPSTGQTGTGPAFEVRGIDPATSQPRSSISANGKTAYLVPAVDVGNPGKTDLYVVTSGWTFLFDQANPTDFTFNAAGNAGAPGPMSVELFGKTLTNWAVYDQLFPPGDPDAVWPRHARARYLNDVSVSTSIGAQSAVDAFVTAASIETDYGLKSFSLTFDGGSESPSVP